MYIKKKSLPEESVQFSKTFWREHETVPKGNHQFTKIHIHAPPILFFDHYKEYNFTAS